MPLKTFCQCPRCFELTTLALLLAAMGDLDGAEMVAGMITRLDPSEGYAESWSAPAVDDARIN